MTAAHDHADEDLADMATHIIEGLDLVEAQLATIRSWAELLIAKKEGQPE